MAFLSKNDKKVLMHLNLSPEVLPQPNVNPIGVLKLIADLAHEIGDFQSDSAEEDENIIYCLEVLIKEIKNRTV